MVEVVQTLKCDWCSEDMDFDETGIFCLFHEKSGHIVCGNKHFKEEH